MNKKTNVPQTISRVLGSIGLVFGVVFVGSFFPSWTILGELRWMFFSIGFPLLYLSALPFSLEARDRRKEIRMELAAEAAVAKEQAAREFEKILGPHFEQATKNVDEVIRLENAAISLAES